jgi:DNA-binding TFAR19-related protein (PDSD5 family)
MAAAKKKNIAGKKSAEPKKLEKKSSALKVAMKPKAKPSLSLLKFPRPNLMSQLSGTGERHSPRLQAVIDKSEIAELLSSFARGIDRIDENLLRSVLHPDATFDLGPGVFQGTGADYVRRRHSTCRVLFPCPHSHRKTDRS